MKNKTQKGYAILITIVVVSIISLIAIGLSRSTYKQLVLSSLAKDSQIAFYQADTASECALYADYKKDLTNPLAVGYGMDFICGGQTMPWGASKTDSNGNIIYLYSPDSNQNIDKPCFRIEIKKELDALGAQITTIDASGYNICDISNIRTVERTIEISY